MYFTESQTSKVMALDPVRASCLSFSPPSDLPFPIYALFRLEPYVGRFPESPNAKEQIVKGHYGRRAKPGERCSLRHLMTRMYLGKREREKEDAGRACLLRESRGWDREERLPDMVLTVVSGEAWKDEGISGGSQVLLAVQTHSHLYHLDVSRPSVSFEAVFRFSPTINVPIFIHSFLDYSPNNDNSAKFGFLCQLKTNSALYLTVLPNSSNGARLKLLSNEGESGAFGPETQEEGTFPEYWGPIPVELTTDETDGNAYWVLEATKDCFTGGIVLGGCHFLLKNVLSRRYIGPDFRLVPRSQAQVFTFPYSAAHSSERVLSSSEKDTESEDIVETYEQYPLLGVGKEAGALVGRRCGPCREDMWGEMFRRAAWRLGDNCPVHQKLVYVEASTPDKLLRFEVRETDLQTARKLVEITGKMSKFVEFHKFLECPEAHPMLEEINGHRRSSSSARFLETSQGDSSDEETSNTSEMPGLEALPGGRFSLPQEALGEIKQLKALITRVKKRKELKFLIDAQIFTEILRLSIFMLSGLSHIHPEVLPLLRPSLSDYLFKAKEVWSYLYAQGSLVQYAVEKHTAEWVEVVRASVDYQRPKREESVIVSSRMRAWEGWSEDVQSLIERLQPDRRLEAPQSSCRTITELMTTHFAEAEEDAFEQRFGSLVKQLTLTEQEVVTEVEYWRNLKEGYKDLRGSAERVDWLMSKIDQRQISGDVIQRIMGPILDLLDLLVDMTIKEEQVKKEMGEITEFTQHYDLEDVKQFVQSVFRLLITFQYWVDFHGLKHYRQHRPMRYSQLAAYMKAHLTLGNLGVEAQTVSLALGLMKRKAGLEEPLIQKEEEGKGTLQSSPDFISIPSLLLKIAKQTRYRVQDRPSALLKLLDKAVNPAQSVARYIHILTLKDSFSMLFAKVRTLLRDLRFYVELVDGGFVVRPADQLQAYIAELESLKAYLDSVTGEPEIVDSLLQCLTYAGFEKELERLWSCCALLPVSLKGVGRLRELACVLARTYAAGSPKRLKHVFRLLSEKTFFIEEPEYLRLLLDLKLIPRDDSFLKPLVGLIAQLSLQNEHLTASGSASLRLLNDNFAIMPLMREILPPDFEFSYTLLGFGKPPRRLSMEEHVQKLRMGFKQQKELLLAFEYREEQKASVEQMLTQGEMMSSRLQKTLKVVYLTDNLVKQYLQAWRYVILSHHSLVRLSLALRGVRKLPGIPSKGRKDRYTTRNALQDPAREVQEVLKSFTNAEIRAFAAQDFDLPSLKDISTLNKHWRGRMQSLIERIIDYICRSSNRSLQKEDLEVLAEIVRDDPASKLQVIEVLGRCRQYRSFFGLFEDCVRRLDGEHHERKEVEELVLAYLRLFQAACDGCFLPFQHYMRVQNDGQHDNINLIHVLTRLLEGQLLEPAKLQTKLATETAIALLEACTGPCPANISIVCQYQRMLREVAKFIQATVTGSELLKKVDSLVTSERKRGTSNAAEALSLPGLESFIKQSVRPQQQQTVFSEPRLMAIMGKMFLKEKKRVIKLNAQSDGISYPGLSPNDLALCTQLVNLLIALLEGSQKRPEKIAELMPSVKFQKFEKVSKWLLSGVSPDFFKRFEEGKLLLTEKAAGQFASPGEVLTFALRCFILYYTALPEEESPDGDNPLRKYIGCVEVQQGEEQLSSVVFPVPFKALHLAWSDTENVLSELASSSREENLKSFVSQLDTYIGEMKFLQGLVQNPLQNYIRSHWKQLFWLAYTALLLVNLLLLLAFDEWGQVGYEVDWPYSFGITMFGGIHTVLRLAGTYAYYLRFSYLILHPLGTGEGEGLLSSLAHTSSPGTIQAYYATEKSKVLLDARNNGVLRAAFNCCLVPISVVAIFLPWLYPFLLLEICSVETTLANIIKALTKRHRQLLLTFAFALLLMYLYAVLGFFFLKEQFEAEPCTTLFQCFTDVVYYGMRLGEGIGEALQTPSPGEKPIRFLYDMSFYILITTILMAIIFGIVVDTFGQLRDEMSEAERNLTANCVICHQPRSSLETKGEGWARHTLLTHNPFSYLYFMTYVKEKDVNDCSGVEKFVRAQLDLRDIGFFPTSFRTRESSR